MATQPTNESPERQALRDIDAELLKFWCEWSGQDAIHAPTFLHWERAIAQHFATPTPTPQDGLVARLRGLLAKATPVPWRSALGSGNNVMTALVGDRGDETEFIADFLPDWALDNCALPADHRHNMDAVTEAINALPDILDAIESAARLKACDDAFYKHTVLQRDAAWLEIERLGRAEVRISGLHADAMRMVDTAEAKLAEVQGALREQVLGNHNLNAKLDAAQRVIAAADAMRELAHGRAALDYDAARASREGK